jgi:hypothetical protein
MTTMTKQETIVKSVAGTDVRNVAAEISEDLIALHDLYGRHFPYNKGKIRNDIGLLLLFGMTDRIVMEFYEMKDGQKIERLSYTYRPESNSEEVTNPSDDLPLYAIEPEWQLRVVSYYSTSKPASEVREFYTQLGWYPSDPLVRTGRGNTERYGEVRSGDFTVTKEVYTDTQDKYPTDHKELTAHEII